jgi:uncharacterized protein with PQ loop repeat
MAKAKKNKHVVTVTHHSKKSRHIYQGLFIDKAIYVAAFIEPATTVPQVLAIYRAKSAAGISMISWVSYLLFSLLWLWYGIIHKQKALIIAYALFAITEILVVAGGLMYGAQW